MSTRILMVTGMLALAIMRSPFSMRTMPITIARRSASLSFSADPAWFVSSNS
jgi:hypothetical protein